MTKKAKFPTLQKLFANKKRWCKFYAHDSKGRCCLIGGVWDVYSKEKDQVIIFKKLRDSAAKLFPTRWEADPTLGGFNDSGFTSIKDIRRLIKHANV